MRISDWSSDVCSSDLANQRRYVRAVGIACITEADVLVIDKHVGGLYLGHHHLHAGDDVGEGSAVIAPACAAAVLAGRAGKGAGGDRVTACDAALQGKIISGQIRSEEHTSELPSLMRISYAVF